MVVRGAGAQRPDPVRGASLNANREIGVPGQVRRLAKEDSK